MVALLLLLVGHSTYIFSDWMVCLQFLIWMVLWNSFWPMKLPLISKCSGVWKSKAFKAWILTTFKIDVRVAKLLARCYICSVEAEGCVCVYKKTWQSIKDLLLHTSLCTRRQLSLALDRSSKVMHFWWVQWNVLCYDPLEVKEVQPTAGFRNDVNACFIVNICLKTSGQE